MKMITKKKIGFILNPIAGMGGKIGLKGTDGIEIYELISKLGLEPWSPVRGLRFLEFLKKLDNNLKIVVYSDQMGGNLVKNIGFEMISITKNENKKYTSSMDTKIAAKKMLEMGVDIIIFVGGDGTARDIQDSVGINIPVIGVPAGVKMYSSVFASSPETAAKITINYLNGNIKKTIEAEVLDIDENLFRNGIYRVKLYGFLKIPYDNVYYPGSKIPTSENEELNQIEIAQEIINNLDNNIYYIIGPGSTTKRIIKNLNFETSLLGIDIIKGRKLIGSNLNEYKILEIINKNKSKLIITPIGGQGYIFGKGNLEISANVIKKIGGKKNIIIISTRNKIYKLNQKPFLIDTNDKELDERLSGWYKVIVGLNEYMMYKAVPSFNLHS
jgi:predicted polyphosphate/ATP-dependent NAD kinase